MTDIVKGMATAYWRNMCHSKSPTREEAMRAALLFLADNVSDEMVDEAAAANVNTSRSAIAAAIRAAAGEEGK